MMSLDKDKLDHYKKTENSGNPQMLTTIIYVRDCFGLPASS